MKTLALIELLVIALLLCTHLPTDDRSKNGKELVNDKHHTIVFSDELFCVEAEDKQPPSTPVSITKPKKIKKQLATEIETPVTHKKVHNGSQFFTFPSNKTVVLEGKNNTKITILPKSFLYEDTQELVQDDITIELKEFYNKSDLVSQRLTTQHQEGFATESAGIVYLNARAGNRKCALVKGKHVLVAFPGYGINTVYTAMKGHYNEDRMLLWNELRQGNLAEFSSTNNTIVLSNRSENTQVTISSSTRLGDTYHNENTNQFNHWLANEFATIISHEDLSDFLVTKTSDGFLFSKEIIYDFKTSLGKAIIASNFPDNERYKWLLKKALYNTPATICKKDLLSNKEYLGSINITVRLNCSTHCAVDDFKHSFHFSDHRNLVDNFVTVTSPSLGWLTASKQLPNVGTSNSLTVTIGTNDFAEVLLVFKDKNIVLSGHKTDLGYTFTNLPENELATIVVTKHANDRTWYSFEKVSTNTPEVTLESFKEYVTKQFRNELKSLNTT